ncbi:hypothetical protein F9U64_18880 [Gracilibacillus oryzae]|uniref:Uncharacterized protein n=1 Tax=Gracilibacillus oryzae TaxID=1672701 RepID=A0A7C8KWZ5_9BACI|nr:hypothetical protein [Gracilibacillus oryzae]KAB8126887.1 hypothetical protein F9U64_18880 [Gracilibacillus oryzae]
MRYLDQQDWEIASRYLFVDMTLRTIERDLNVLKQASPFKITEPYIALLNKLKKVGTAERKKLKNTMHQKKITVTLNEKQDSFTSYLFATKGKQEERNYFNPAIRKKVENILNEWMNQGEEM